MSLVWVLGVVVGLVMLQAASNAGGLLLVQWLGRGRELATRHALGATSGRIVASLLLHSLLLVAAAWLLALLGSMQALAVLNRSEEHTSELQSLMRISYAVFCLKNTN